MSYFQHPMIIMTGVVLAGTTLAMAGGKDEPPQSPGYVVACYYFPNYHVDPRNEARHGPGWTEWELVRRAEPRFEGHQQPKVPLWGYEDESDPKVMDKKIVAAADHGIDAFIFDWYWYDDGPFLEKALNEGFLKAPHNDRLRFGIMWANHDWTDVHPAKMGTPPPLQYPGKITPATFEKMTDHLIRDFFKHPSYWRIDGRPYFSIYELYKLVDSFGGVDATATALRRFREKAKSAGLPDLHINAVAWGIQILPGEKTVKNEGELISRLGIDSVTSYIWIHHVPLPDFPQTAYARVFKQAVEHWGKAGGQYGVPYFPNVTMGWDTSPRTVQSDRFANRGYTFMTTMSGNTPEAFKEAMVAARKFLDSRADVPKILTINAWNEWTEGSYLEPDKISGMKYLEAIKAVLGTP